MVVPGTYEVKDPSQRTLLPIWSLLTSIPRALGEAQDIIFFLFIVGGAIGVLRATGTIDALLGAALKKIGHKPFWLVFLGLTSFAIGSSTLGIAEEYIPFTAILIAMCLSMGMDRIIAVSIVVVGYGIGYGVAALNPFTVLIAQQVAEVPPTSGLWFRLLIFFPFLGIGVHHILSYIKKNKATEHEGREGYETLSSDLNPNLKLTLTNKHLIVFSLCVLALIIMSLGIAQKGWYILELSSLFVALAIFSGLLGGLGSNGTAHSFSQGVAEMAPTAILIGFARSIALILEDGQVLHTVVHGLSAPMASMGAEMGAVFMLGTQMVLNFFIPSGSGQAFITMPIMAPLSDLIGISRQVAVLAFQFGDGFANMIVPTNPVLMAILGIAGVSYAKWFKFIAPLMLKLFVAGAFTLMIGIWVGLK